MWAVLLFLLFLSPTTLHSEPLTVLIRQSWEKLEKNLPALKAAPEDLAIPSRWPVPHALDAVEEILEKPSVGPARLSSWAELTIQNESISALLKTARSLLGENGTPAVGAEGTDPVSRILKAVEAAHGRLQSSYSSLTVKERNDILRVHDYPADQDPGESPRDPSFKIRAFKSMEKFKQEELLAAASLIAGAVEKEIGNLKTLKPARFATKFGDVIISGPEDNVYGPGTLSHACLLIDLGGRNRYDGPVAGAREGEIKIAIDFGEDVTVTSTEAVVSAGAGAFGIGVFLLPNSSGTKTLQTNSYSQGFGLCGVGILGVSGRGVFHAGRYVQGTAAFGAGIFSHDKAGGSEYAADVYGQGVGFTRGVGIFRHAGSSSTLRAGLVDPDPREPLGMTSLCQGVGYGPRAFAGGGIGICALKGDGITVESSYFAQGAGYWHAAGTFYLEGNRSYLKARRYDQGSGVHSAAGAFFLKGDGNRTVNWGVGPAFGWDRSIGWAFLLGNGNASQTEWGSASAVLNASRSFLFSKGINNILELPAMGEGGYTREVADYGLAVIEGPGAIVRSPYFSREPVSQSFYTSPWGRVRFHDVTLSSETLLPKEDWTPLPREAFSQREAVDLGEELNSAAQDNGPEKIEKLVSLASAFSVEKGVPRQALAHLVLLPRERLPDLLKLLRPEDFDGFIQIRAALSILGPEAEDAILRELASSSGERRAWMLAQVVYLNARTAAPPLLASLKDPDWRIRFTALRGLAFLFSRDRGFETGRMPILENLKVYFSSAAPGDSFEYELARELSSITFFEAAAILSLCGPKTAEEKILFLAHAPQELTGNFELAKVRELLKYLHGKREAVLLKIAAEIAESETYDARAGKAVPETLKENRIKRKEILPAALFALGSMAHAEDVSRIEPFLQDSSAPVKEAASSALGRMGMPAYPALQRAVRSPDPKIRILALTAVRNFWDPALLPILEEALKDGNEEVRKAAISAVNTLRFPLGEKREELKARLKKESPAAPEAVRLQIRYLYGK